MYYIIACDRRTATIGPTRRPRSSPQCPILTEMIYYVRIPHAVLASGRLKELNAMLIVVYGDVAQLGEHYVRNVGVGGSNPLISTKH